MIARTDSAGLSHGLVAGAGSVSRVPIGGGLCADMAKSWSLPGSSLVATIPPMAATREAAEVAEITDLVGLAPRPAGSG